MPTPSEQLAALRRCPAGEFSVEELMMLMRASTDEEADADPLNPELMKWDRWRIANTHDSLAALYDRLGHLVAVASMSTRPPHGD